MDFTTEEKEKIMEIAKDHYYNPKGFNGIINNILGDTPEPTDFTNTLTVLKSHDCAVRFQEYHNISDELRDKLLESYKNLEKFIYE